MIKVQEGSLGTLEENVLAFAGGLVDGAGAVDHMGGQPAAVVEVLADHRVGIQGLHRVDRLEQLILLLQRPFQTLPEPLLVQKIDHPDPAALGLVGIGGADAAPGGADPTGTALLLHRLIQQAVIGHRHVSRRGQLQPRDVDIVLLQHFEFAEHHPRVDHGP